MPIPLPLIGGALMAGGTILGGIQGAANAKAQAIANEFQTRWDNLQNGLAVQRQNFMAAQQFAAETNRREYIRSTSLSQQLAEQREILRSTKIVSSRLSTSYMEAVGTTRASIESRGMDAATGTGKLLLDQARQSIMVDLAEVRRNSAIAYGNAAARRQTALADLGPLTQPLANTYIPGQPSIAVNTSGMLAAAAIKGFSYVLNGAAESGLFNTSPTTSGASK